MLLARLMLGCVKCVALSFTLLTCLCMRHGAHVLPSLCMGLAEHSLLLS